MTATSCKTADQEMCSGGYFWPVLLKNQLPCLACGKISALASGEARLAKGEGLAVDASSIKADASRLQNLRRLAKLISQGPPALG